MSSVVLTSISNLSPAAEEDVLVTRVQRMPTAILSNAMDALGMSNALIGGAVRRLAGERFAGRARTVDRVPAPSNAQPAHDDPRLAMGVQLVIDASPPGSVIVVAAQGDRSAAMWGGNMAIRARRAGVRAVVTDGAVRDLDEMDGLGLVTFAAATCSRQASSTPARSK